MKGKIIFTLCFIALAAAFIRAQTTTPQTDKVIVTDKIAAETASLPANDLPTILQKSEQQTTNYREEFKNLLGVETKTFESFDKNGKSKKQTVVESNFIVYQATNDAAKISEYRNVVKVDGKTVGDSDKRAADLFENLAKSASPKQELEDVQRESLRYDKTLHINGLTLFQSPVFEANIRPFFDFALAGEETVDGAGVYVIAYQQKSKSPYVLFNDDQPKPEAVYFSFDVDGAGSIKEPNALLRGKIWIDKETFQVRRERRELTIQPAGLAAPLVVNETEFLYEPSDLGILTPRRIAYTDYNVKSKNKGKDISAVLDTKATFEYGKFTKSDVEVKSGEVKN